MVAVRGRKRVARPPARITAGISSTLGLVGVERDDTGTFEIETQFRLYSDLHTMVTQPNTMVMQPTFVAFVDIRRPWSRRLPSHRSICIACRESIIPQLRRLQESRRVFAGSRMTATALLATCDSVAAIRVLRLAEGRRSLHRGATFES